VKLKAANIEKDGKTFTTMRRPDGNVVILAYVPKTLEPTLPMPFPFQTRYVAFIPSRVEAGPVSAFYLSKAFDKSQYDDMFPTANYSETEKAYDLLFHHVVEHLVMGVEPVNVKSQKFQ
jgi:hypothetical protein